MSVRAAGPLAMTTFPEPTVSRNLVLVAKSRGVRERGQCASSASGSASPAPTMHRARPLTHGRSFLAATRSPSIIISDFISVPGPAPTQSSTPASRIVSPKRAASLDLVLVNDVSINCGSRGERQPRVRSIHRRNGLTIGLRSPSGAGEARLTEMGRQYLLWFHAQPITLFDGDKFLPSLSSIDPEVILALQALVPRFPPGVFDFSSILPTASRHPPNQLTPKRGTTVYGASSSPNPSKAASSGARRGPTPPLTSLPRLRPPPPPGRALRLRLRHVRRMVTVHFIQQSFESLSWTAGWVVFFLDVIEKTAALEAPDPVVARRVVVIGTIHLRHGTAS
ncbi:hypothetical protein CSUB01_06531 [Colletotrichum sublineola]|uniref:Uncharacterized protein n=1 Tax=Colletotrichum sublineola TaxID=1173701 RepID=A0A066X1B9_COLSU|nr:hypothetical protein CSUB01_06531 [Colletotrichum sublineola]